MIQARLHHFTCNIAPGTLDTMIELLKLFGCSQAYREKDAIWCMMEQKPIPIDIQVIEVEPEEVPIDKKLNIHLAFASDNPEEDIAQVKSWAEKNSVKFQKGEWYEGAVWFDLPEVFNNFVIEIISNKIVKQEE